MILRVLRDDDAAASLRREVRLPASSRPTKRPAAIAAVGAETGRAVERERVRQLAGAVRLQELAVATDDPATRPRMVAGVLEVLARA